MTEKACRNCKLIIPKNICPDCKTTNVSDDWIGEVIILDPNKSKIATSIGVKTPGRYAINVR